MLSDNTQSVVVVVYPRVDLFVSADKMYFDQGANTLRFHVLNQATNATYNYEAFGSILAVIAYFDANSTSVSNVTVTLPHISAGTSLLINSTLPSTAQTLVSATITLVYPEVDLMWSSTGNTTNGTTLLNPPANTTVISTASAVLSKIISTDFTHALTFGVPAIIAPHTNNLEKALMNVPFFLPVSLSNWDVSYDPTGLVCL